VLIRVQSYSIAHLIKGWEGQFLEKMTRSKNTLPLVLHVSFGYFPSPVGGTEVYVAALCRELQSLGVANVVAAPGMASLSMNNSQSHVSE
jgi:hypothetical protein